MSVTDEPSTPEITTCKKQIIPTLEEERRPFISALIESCHDPSVFENVENSVDFYKRTRWIHKKRREYSDYSKIEKRNVLYEQIDFITHCFNLFSSYLDCPHDSYFRKTYADVETFSEWKEFPEVLSFLEPHLPDDKKLRSVIHEGPYIFNSDYSGLSDKDEEMTIDKYRLYFKNFILPAYIWIWKKILGENTILERIKVLDDLVEENFLSLNHTGMYMVIGTVPALFDRLVIISPDITIGLLEKYLVKKNGQSFSRKFLEREWKKVKTPFSE